MSEPLRVCVLDDYQRVASSCAEWSSLPSRVAVDFVDRHIADRDELVMLLAPYEVVVLMRERTPMPADVLARLPNLRLLVTTGPFNAVIDLEAAQRHGVVVCGTGSWAPPTMELTWALILACVKQLIPVRRALDAGAWQTTIGGDLAGARLGVVGLGRFGERVARIGLAFAMDVVAWSSNLTAERCAEVGVSLVGKDELFATSDVVTVHLVLSDRTRHLVGERELRAMKPSAFLVNTSRGPIVDEQALIAALTDHAIAGAGLDVFDVEPLPVDHPLRHLDNVVVTPHVGYVSRRAYEVFYGDVVDDIRGYLDGNPVRQVGRAPGSGGAP